MWPTSFWLFPLMPWLLATRLPAAYCVAMLPELLPRGDRASAEIIPFRPRRLAAG